MQRINLSETRITPEVLGVMPVAIARMYSVLPIRVSDQNESGEKMPALEVVVGDDVTTGFWADQYQKEIDFALSRRVIPVYVATPKEIETAMRQWYG